MTAPPPVPALPDVERRTTYAIAAQTGPFAVGFALLGDSVDFANWVEVWLNGVLVPASGNWTITSPSGPLSTLPRPITDAVLTFTSVQTGTVQIVGARRPRRTSQLTESQGVAARDHNQIFTDVIAQLREMWDRASRMFSLPPGVGTMTTTVPVAGEFLKWNATANGVESAAVITPSGSYPIATQSEAEAGTLNNVLMTPLRTKQSSKIASAVMVDSRATAIATSFNASTNFIQTGGYAAFGDGGHALYTRTAGSTAGGFQSADGAWWKIVGPIYNWRAFGAVGDGVANDSAAIQGSIDLAQTIGGISFGPPGSYKLSTGLSLTDRVSFEGVGFEKSGSSSHKCTVLLPAASVTCISVNTAAPVSLKNFQITYPSTPGIAITLNQTGGGTNGNIDTIIRDVGIVSANIGFQTTNAYTFTLDNVRFDGAIAKSCELANINVPGSGDCLITKCVFSGLPTIAHIQILSGGGLRIVNNKLNGGAIGIAVQANAVTAQGIAPFFISNNSIEGNTSFGILIQRTAGATELFGSFVISNNQIAAGGIAIQAAPTGTNPWVIGGNISGNIVRSGGAGAPCISIVSAQDVVVAGNMLISGDGAAANGVTISSCTRVTETANGRGLNVT